jgi:hypothetical protein
MSILVWAVSLLITLSAASAAARGMRGTFQPAAGKAGYQEWLQDPLASAFALTSNAPQGEARLRAPVDGDPTTSLALGPGQNWTLTFSGAPRWISQLAITGAAGACEVKIQDWYDKEIIVGQARFDGGVQVIEFPSTPVQAIALEVPETARGAQVQEMTALNKGRATDEDGNYELYYTHINNYGESAHNASHRDEDCHGLEAELGWDSWEVSENAAYEKDWKREEVGGWEDDWVDTMDLGYFSGSMKKKDGDTCFYFEVDDQEDSRLRPHDHGDVWESWGFENDSSDGGDLEWVVAQTGKLFEEHENRSEWSDAMWGLHLLCSWSTQKDDVDMGTPFGNDLVGDNDSDSPLKIKQAYWNAADATHPSGRKLYILGENYDMGEDYIWDQASGPGEDPTPNEGGVAYRLWNHTTSKGADAEIASPGPVKLDDCLLLAPRAPGGFTVFVGPQAAVPSRELMPRYPLTPNIDTIQNIAVAFNVIYPGRLAGGTVGDDGSGNDCLTDGPDLLRVSQQTGAANLIAIDRWLGDSIDPIAIMTPAAAQVEAEGFLQAMGRLPGDAVFLGTSSFGWEEWDVTGGMIGSSATNIRVEYGREIDGFPVWGPGARIILDYGEGNDLHYWSEGGWRTTGLGEDVELLKPVGILAHLALYGARVTINGVSVAADTLIVLEPPDLGYWEFDRWTDQAYLEPVYRFTAYTARDSVTSTPIEPYTIYMYASTLDLTDVPPAAALDVQAYPNPFNPTLTIRYQMPQPGNLRIRVFDLSGRLVRTLIDGFIHEKTGSVRWDGTDDRGHKLASNVYLYCAETSDQRKVGKITLTR